MSGRARTARMLTRRPAPARRHAPAKAVGAVWFTIVALPVMFFAAGLAIDFTRLIVASHEVVTVANAAALGGAQEFTPGDSTLDEPAAESAAQATFEQSRADGVLRLTSSATAAVDTTSSSVTVAVSYHINDLLFIRYFLGSGDFANTISRTASVCVPGQVTGPTGGFCTRPG